MKASKCSCVPPDLHVLHLCFVKTGGVFQLMFGRRGLWSLYVSRTEKGPERRACGLWDPLSRLKRESRRPTLPISCLHFISIFLSVISGLLKLLMKALLQIDVCASSLRFMGHKWGTLSSPSPPSFSFYFIHVCFLRCHKSLVYIRVPLKAPFRSLKGW